MNGRASSYVTPSIVTCCSCMHSSSAACVFGEARLISSTSSRFAKTGPGPELELVRALVEDVHAGDVRRQQVGRELHARERHVERARERLREHRLPHSRKVLEDQVALADEAEDAQAGASRRARARRVRGCRRSRGSSRPRRRVSTRWLSGSLTQQLLGRIDDRRRDLGLSGPCRRVARRPAPTSTTSLSSASKPMSLARDVVEDDEVDALLHRASRARARGPALPGRRRSRSAPGRSSAAPRASRRTSVVGSSVTCHASLVLRRASRRALRGPVVGDGGSHQDDVGVASRASACVEHRLRRSASRRPRRRAGGGTARFAASSVTSAPRFRASSARATPIRPDERLPRKRTASSGSRVPPALTSTRRPRERVGLAEQLAAAPEDLLGLGHPPDAPTRPRPSRLRPGRRSPTPRDRDGLDVRLRRRVRPHARVHRRREQHRAAVRERGLGDEVVGEPVRELRERVRRRAAR